MLLKIKNPRLTLNRGLTKFENGEKKYFIINLLPDEEADCQIIHENRTGIYCVPVHWDVVSPDRLQPHLNPFDALDYDYLTPERQGLNQEQMTKLAFKNEPHRVFQPVTLNPTPWHYRNKITVFVANRDPLRWGIYQANENYFGPKELVAIEAHPLAKPGINAYLQQTAGQGRLTEEGLDGVVIHVNTLGQIYLNFLVSQKIEHLPAWLVTPAVLGISQSFHDRGQVRYTHYLQGKPYFPMYLGQDQYLLAPGAFFQVTDLAQAVFARIEQLIPPQCHLIDAFCGVGVIGCYLRKKVRTVTFLEINRAAGKSLNLNMKNLGVNGTFLPGDANLIIPTLVADVMVVDPPREGLQRSTIMALLESKISEIIYLSCDLKSGSRDCLALLKKYEILQIYPFQFFPQTFNFETLIHLRLRPGNRAD